MSTALQPLTVTSSVPSRWRHAMDQIRSFWSGPFTSSSHELAHVWGETPSSTGIRVSEETALNYSAVWAAVSLISSQVASLPLILYKRLPNGGKERFADHKLYRLLHDEPNPEMTSMLFRETVQAHALTWGNGYAEIERDGAGRPMALWPITPDRVTPLRASSGLLQYRIVNPDTRDVLIPKQNMLHIPGLGFDGTCGYSVIAKARESIGLGLATERFGATFFGQGATFGGILSHPANPGDVAIDSLRKQINAGHQGTDRAHRFLILQGGMTYERLGIPPNDAQFLETRKFQIPEICRWFNLPPHKLKDLDRSTNNNIEHQNLEYYIDCLRAWLVRWEQELNRKLIAPAERNIQFAEHVVAGLLRGDVATRGEFYTKLLDRGVFSINDVLGLENMNSIPGGDVHLVQRNMVPLERLPEVIDAEIASSTPPVDDEAELERTRAALAEQAAVEARAEVVRLTDALAVAAEAKGVAEQAIATTQAEAARSAEALQRSIDQATAVAAAAFVEAKAFQTEAAAKAEEAASATSDRDAKLIEAAGWRTRAEDAQASATVAAAELERVKVIAADERRAREVTKREIIDRFHVEMDELQESIEVLQASVAEAEARAAAALRDRDAQLTLTAEAQADRDRLSVDADEALVAVRQLLQAEVEGREAQRQAEQVRVSSVISAHRDLIADVMGRMLRREVEKAKRNQLTPAKLKTWAEAFYVGHEDTCIEALLPAVRAHLAWLQSSADPGMVTAKYVREHITESLAQVRTVADSDPEDYPMALERMLMKWERDRSVTLADRLLQEGIAYVAGLH